MALQLSIGDTASLSKTFTGGDVEKFAEVSLDNNPIHLNEDAAAESVFDQRVVHGALVSSLFSAILGTDLPGKGTIYLAQSSSFKRPVFIGDAITAHVEVTDIIEAKKIAKLRTWAVNSDGKIVIDGDATVKLP
jgi:acyl dehydratase